MRHILLRFAIYVGYFVASCWGACVAAPDQSDNSSDASAYRAYSGKVVTVVRLSNDFVASESYRDFAPFVELANEGAQHVDYSIRFLSEQEHTSQERRIAIWSMYKLGPHEYVLFLRKLAGLFDRDLVSLKELRSGVIARFTDVILENYAENDVQAVLKEIAARNGVPSEMKSYIESLLSGKALENLQAFRRDCCVPRKVQ